MGSKPPRFWQGPLIFSVAAITIGLSLASYNPLDPSLNTLSDRWQTPTNLLGHLGSWTSDGFFQLFGYLAWLWPILLVVALIRVVSEPSNFRMVLGPRFWSSLGLVIVGTTMFLHMILKPRTNLAFPPEGLIGVALAEISRTVFGPIGTYIVSLLLIWAACFVWWHELPQLLAEGLTKAINLGTKFIAQKLQARRIISSLPAVLQSPSVQPSEKGTPAITVKIAGAAEAPIGGNPLANKTWSGWSLPPLSLLEKPSKETPSLDRDQLLAISKKITSALHSFEIQGEITEISPGPTITLYEFQPAAGVRVQKLVAVSTDLAMALGAPSVRIVAPIPGKSVAGIEVPNDDKAEIILRDVIETTFAKAQQQRLPLLLGKDISGTPVVEDLSRMPHLLVGGATSMGKSVLINSLLTGLLCRFTPQTLRLIIVDPKLVEFKIFEDIPHLLLPIVNDPKDASQALKWAVNETRRRYLEMQKVSAKNLEAYNQKIGEGRIDSEGRKVEAFPYIVIIIDELAELMLTAKRDAEQSIVRLSQLARAAGIHLIMATQRPSSDVVTGLIKSNCPARAALRVASATDSRIIMDCSGAEQLLGKGDMFFTNTGPMGMRRIQGPFVSDSEVEKVCDFWRSQGDPEYHEEILKAQPEDDGTETSSAEKDQLYGDVIDFAREKGSISTSLIQRRFQIGYTRAARIMEQLEEAGVVGEAEAAGKARPVNI